MGAALVKKARLNNDNTPTAVGDVLRGALNKVSRYSNIDATSEAICAAYAKFPANDVHAFVSSHMRETCVHGAQNMEALVPPTRGHGSGRHEGRPRARRTRRVGSAAAGFESEGKRRGNAAALLAAFCDVGLCGGELTMSYAEALRDDGTADALEALLSATGSRDVWRRSDLRGRLSKLAVKDESGDDARLLQAKNALRNACASKPGDVSRSKSLRAAVARAVPNGRARRAAAALSWSDLRNAEATGRWWRRGAAYDRHAQDALADDVAQRRAAKTVIKAGADHARAAPEHAGEARGVRGRRGRGRRP